MKRALILVAAAVVVGFGWYRYSRPRAQTLVLTGTVDGNEVVVGAQINGRIVKMAVSDGQEVKAGDLIAVLDQGVQRADTQAAAAAIAQARADTRQSEAQLDLLAATLPARLKMAQAQQAQTQAQLRQAQAQVSQAQAAWDKAHSNYLRVKTLAAKGVSSPQELDNAKADLDTAEANRTSAQAGVQAAQRARAAAQANVQDARQQQRQLAVQQQQTAALSAAARQAQASHAAAVARLGQTEVRAPVNGIITLRAAREGEVVGPASPIATIYTMNDTWVDADVEETYAPLVQMGEKLKVRLPDGQIIQGPVVYKAVEAEFATQRDVSRTKRDIKTVQIRVAVPNPKGQLALGMTAYVLLPVPANPAESAAGAPPSPAQP